MSRVNPRLVYWIAAVHQHPQLTAAHRDVLTYLAVCRLDYSTGRGYCSEESLAEGRGCSVATVRRALTIARDVAPQLLERTRRGHRLGNGQSAASEWRLIYPPISTAQDSTVESASTAQRRAVEDVSTAQNRRLNRSETASQPLTGERPTELLSEDPSSAQADVVKLVQLEVHGRTGKTIDERQAKRVVALILEGARRPVGNVGSYLRTSIVNDPDPARFLPTPQPESFAELQRRLAREAS